MAACAYLRLIYAQQSHCPNFLSFREKYQVPTLKETMAWLTTGVSNSNLFDGHISKKKLLRGPQFDRKKCFCRP
jgi:hypothetical protein